MAELFLICDVDSVHCEPRLALVEASCKLAEAHVGIIFPSSNGVAFDVVYGNGAERAIFLFEVVAEYCRGGTLR